MKVKNIHMDQTGTKVGGIVVTYAIATTDSLISARNFSMLGYYIFK